MKYYLMKQESYDIDNEPRFTYLPLQNGVDIFTISKDFIIYDELNGKMWCCFLYIPKPSLRKLNKSQTKRFLDDIIPKELDITKDEHHEVTEQDVLTFLDINLARGLKEKDKDRIKYLRRIIKKVKNIKGE